MDSKLLLCGRESAGLSDSSIRGLPAQFKPGDLLVLNDTRVVQARLYGHKTSGGKVELLIEKQLPDNVTSGPIKASKTPKVGSTIVIADGVEAEVLGRDGGFFSLRWSVPVAAMLKQWGHVPLPPYMERQDEAIDQARYQTVYAEKEGAAAAPTAGLHFDDTLLAEIKKQSVDIGFLTLHVGSGTFQPLREDDPRDHRIHSEWLSVDAGLCEQIKNTQARGGRVVAVGTTVVRGLEAAFSDGMLGPYQGETELYILPGFEFNVVDALFTNFHMPESTLLMLVSAFAGYKNMMAAYDHALANDYRFLSYGDAMFIS